MEAGFIKIRLTAGEMLLGKNHDFKLIIQLSYRFFSVLHTLTVKGWRQGKRFSIGAELNNASSVGVTSLFEC